MKTSSKEKINKIKKLIKASILSGLLVCSADVFAQGALHEFNAMNTLRQHQQELVIKLTSEYPDLSQGAIVAGLRAYQHLRAEGQDTKHLLTVIDNTLPSNQKRLWVIDMDHAHVLYNTLVAQGEKSGLVYARHFSDSPNSHATSLGVYLTGQTYYGKDGYSMRLHGLDRGFNDNVYKRAVVMHGAWYVSENYAREFGRIGRTFGCFGLSQEIEPHIVQTIKNDTVLVAYYPDQAWLYSSRYEKPILI